MRLTVSLEKGIVVVVPQSMNQQRTAKLIPEFIKDKQQWLRDTINRLRLRGQQRPDIKGCALPLEITLTALNETFFIHYISASVDDFNGGSLVLNYGNTHKGQQQLEVCGDLSHKQRVFALLEMFFKDYARFFLQQRLDTLSREFNLPYNRLTVRAQKTRWGSCSAKKNINLNYRLLFIDADLLDYILLHELVHTVHMNHSKAFWHYFEALLPDAREKDRRVNLVTKKLPCWIFYKELL